MVLNVGKRQRSEWPNIWFEQVKPELIYHTESGHPSYLHWWYAASEKGNPEAQAFVGDQSTEPALAFHWHLRAAENGHAPSFEEVAYCYQGGDGVDANDDKAGYWYQRAAERGSMTALFELGRIRFGRADGAAPDDDDWIPVFRTFHAAAYSGHPVAASVVVNFYVGGVGTVRDLAKAYAWAKLSHSRNYEYGRDKFVEVWRECDPEDVHEGEKLFPTLMATVPLYRQDVITRSVIS